jgi:[acyl-carrier-protein] S-malonyltransferase
MAAVMGMVPQRLEEICAEADGIVGPANFNAPQQIVISGENDALAGVAAAAKAEGARVIRLKVSVAAHSALMRPARDELAAALQHVSTKGPRVPVVSGVDGRVHEDAAELLRLLVEGVTRPVRWVECVETMAANGAGRFVETGPGEVLSGLVKRIVPGAQLAQVGDDTAAESLAKELAAVGGGADGHRV